MYYIKIFYKYLNFVLTSNNHIYSIIHITAFQQMKFDIPCLGNSKYSLFHCTPYLLPR